MNVQNLPDTVETIDSSTFVEYFSSINMNDFSDDKFASNIEQPQRVIDCKYQYDNIGSYIFKLQCQQPEYYLTRSEESILNDNIEEILCIAECDTLVDLGAGSGEKVISALQNINPSSSVNSSIGYMPIDLNEEILRDCISSFRVAGLLNPIHAIVGTYPDVLEAAARHDGPKLFSSFGSSVANQEMFEIVKFLASVRACLAPDDKFLIGVDVTNDRDEILNAYNDENSISRIHNLNVLNHVNRRHRANFDVDDFEAVSEFNPDKWRIESYVMSRSAQVVTCLDGDLQIRLDAGERIRTEISQKFVETEVVSLISGLGFRHVQTWRDDDDHFLLAMFRATAETPAVRT